MTFSLITVHEQTPNGRVSGNWVQNHIGTLETATVIAQRTEAVNGHKITVAVVAEVNSVTPMLEYHENKVRLDTRH